MAQSSQTSIEKKRSRFTQPEVSLPPEDLKNLFLCNEFNNKNEGLLKKSNVVAMFEIRLGNLLIILNIYMTYSNISIILYIYMERR